MLALLRLDENRLGMLQRATAILAQMRLTAPDGHIDELFDCAANDSTRIVARAGNRLRRADGRRCRLIGQNVIKPLGPSHLGYGQIVLENLERGRFKGVQGLDGNTGDGVPANMWVRIRNVWSSNRRDSPSLVGERVVVQPLVSQHAAEEDKPEGHVILKHLTLDDSVVMVHAEKRATKVNLRLLTNAAVYNGAKADG